MPDKPRVTIVFGAGATIGAMRACYPPEALNSGQNLYSTSDITNHIKQMQFPQVALQEGLYSAGQNEAPEPLSTLSTPISVIPWMFRALNGYFRDANFEMLLAAIEDLELLSRSRYSEKADDRYLHPLNPFLRVSSAYPFLNDWRLLQHMRHAIIAKIMAFLPGAGTSPPKAREAYSDMLTGLLDAFDLDIFTLNYDLIIDQALKDASISAYDGFVHICGADGSVCLEFDTEDFYKTSQTTRCLLAHLHGNVAIGYMPQVNGRLPRSIGELGKFADPNKALESVDNVHMSEPAPNGQLSVAGPLISGVNKSSKITGTTIPFGYYYQAFANSVARNNKLLVIGYGGADPHVNTWIAQLQHIHPDQARYVLVTDRAGWGSVADPGTGMNELVYGAGGEPEDPHHYVDPAASGIQEWNSSVRLITDGFPISVENLDAIRDYLQS